MHTRYVYNILDFLGDIGGVTQVFTVMAGVFVMPISYFSFIMKATKKLFLVRTAEQDLFLDEDPVQKKKQDQGVKFNRHMKKEYKLHKKF